VLRFCLDPSPAAEQLAVAAAFAEVYLAKEGHDGLVGINLLRKIEYPILAQLYGARASVSRASAGCWPASTMC